MKNKSFYLGGWGSPHCEPKDYELARDAGIDHFLVTEEYSESGELKGKKEIDYAARVGIKSVLHIGNDYLSSTKTGLKKRDTDYGAIAADRICYSDEPIYANFPVLKAWAKEHDEKYGDTRTYYVNLLLVDMHPEEMGDTPETQTFDNYIGKFCSEVLSEIKKGERILSCDCYPLIIRDGKTVVRKKWLYNLETMMYNAVSCGAKHEEYVQVVEYNDLPRSTEESIRYQAYVLLNFGTSGLTYFTYSSPVADFKNSCVNLDESCSLNDQYYYVKNVNKELRAFENEYLNCSVDGVMPVYGTEYSLNKDSAIEEMKKPLSELYGVKSISATEDTLISEMTHGSGKKAYVITNFSNPYDGKTDTVDIKFDGKERLAVWQRGVRKEYEAKDGSFSLVLGAGDGVFVMIL